MASRSVRTISKENMDSLQIKIRGNISRMLDFLNKTLGTPIDPNYEMDKVYVYENYAIFTHAVEEYGKLLYLQSIIPDSIGNYEVEYRRKFRSHETKFDLALAKLPDSIKTVYKAQFDSSQYDSTNYSTDDTQPNWDNRLNVLNVDIDDNGKPTDITFHVDIDELRQSVFDFRNFPY